LDISLFHKPSQYDQGDEPEDTVRMAGGAVDVEGGLILQELEHLAHVGLPEGDYETVGGFMLERLGRIPPVGDTLEIPGYDLKVVSMDGLRIGRVRVTPAE
jgi:putative hemolysin